MNEKVLPNSDKYRRVEPARKLTWADKIIEKARTEVRIEDVLSHFGIQVPYEAKSWKTRCPLAYEHEDGGLDKQFRVYSDNNRAYCFAMHNGFDTIRLWRLLHIFATNKEAAENLLDTYGIEFRKKSYRERFEDLLSSEKALVVDPESLIEAFQVFLSAQPNYDEFQYRQDVLHSVNLFLGKVYLFCEQAQNQQEVEQWFQMEKSQMLKLLNSLR